MIITQDQPDTRKAGHLMSLLTPPQRDLVEQRRRVCEPCSQNQKLSVVSVKCEACGCAGVSLIHGRCKLRKWPSAGKDDAGNPVVMPKPLKPERVKPEISCTVNDSAWFDYEDWADAYLRMTLSRYTDLPSKLMTEHFGMDCPSSALCRYLSVVLNTLKLWDRFAEQLGVRYSLFAGSALGARLLGGPIPWDDDIDVFVPQAAWGTLRGAWSAGEAVYPTREGSFICRESEIDGVRVHLLMHRIHPGWLKLRIPSRFDSDHNPSRRSDVGGIDIMHVIDQGGVPHESVQLHKTLPSHLLHPGDVERVDFGPVQTFLATGPGLVRYLERELSPEWRDFTHPAAR